MQVYDCGKPDVNRAADFFSEYAVELFGSGCTCIRLEKNIQRIASSLGMNVEFSVLPRHIHLTVGNGTECTTRVVRIRELPISFARITDLSRLSWEIADGKIPFDEAYDIMPRVFRSPSVQPRLLALYVAVANAAFCRLFSGDIIAMCAVFVATYLGFRLKQILTSQHVNFKLTVLICAFVSSVITALSGLSGFGATPQIAVATSVLYLVPGIPFINSFCDFLDAHYLCAFGRLMHALIILCCLSLGLLAGMLLMNLSMF
ncbi:MAG: threonine/serine exporter family protein [Muribaculaceae bacterium]|nr:threonine/serine exporter family protein [Muribaculaceae bacterium]